MGLPMRVAVPLWRSAGTDLVRRTAGAEERAAAAARFGRAAVGRGGGGGRVVAVAAEDALAHAVSSA